MRQFGCILGKNEEEISGTFTYRNYNHPLYFTPDAPHMLKLARNALANLKCFVDGENNFIEWKYITLLHQVQLQEGLKFANKISRKHVEFHRNKMSR